MISSKASLRRVVTGMSVAAALTMAASSAVAATAGNITNLANPANDGVFPVHGANTWAGFYNATLYLIGGPANIEVTYVGHEASYINDFNFGTISASTTGGAGWTAG